MTIHDEFTDLPISSQRRHQLRQRRDGRCIGCNRKSAKARCRKCAGINADRNRKRKAGEK